MGFDFVPSVSHDGDWESYFKEYGSQLRTWREGLEDEDNKRATEVTTKARAIDKAELPRTAKTIHTNLEAAGWILGAQSSETHTSGGVYGETAQKAGEAKPEVHMIHYWLAGRKGKSQFIGWWTNDGKANKFQDALTSDVDRRKVITAAREFDAWLLDRSIENDEQHNDTREED
jgi:hypothetical protein